MKILTHRGLQPSIKNFFPESTWEAFCHQLDHGYGLEFDFQPTKDGELVVFHSPNLSAISYGAITSKLSELDSGVIRNFTFDGCRLCFLEELMEKIMTSKAKLSALHFKGLYQTDDILEILIGKISGFDPKRFIIFDVKVETAEKLKKRMPSLQLAPSVAHPYDIKRYNSAVHGTLMTPVEAAANRDVFNWVWLDEWDRTDENGGDKTFYSSEVFDFCREKGFNIGLVTPELHATSPGLLGGESHPDAQNRLVLFRRIAEIMELKPDLICTDLPEEVKEMQIRE